MNNTTKPRNCLHNTIDIQLAKFDDHLAAAAYYYRLALEHLTEARQARKILKRLERRIPLREAAR